MRNHIEQDSYGAAGEQADQEISELQGQIDELEEKVDSLESENERLKDILDLDNEEILSLRVEVEDLKASVKQKVEDYTMENIKK